MEEVFGNATISLDIDNVTENGIENYDALKQAVLADVEVYKGVVIQEDNLEEAPKWRAELNKKAKRISDFRIAFEKDFKKKIEKSTSQLKELTAIYTDASNNIDSQVKTFDDKRKQEKQDAIQALFDETFSDWKNVIDLARVESYSDGKWMNKGTSIDVIKKFMQDTRKKIESGINSIRGLNSKYEREMFLAFLKRLDIGDALSKKSELENFEQQMAARKAAEEETKKRLEEERSAREEAARQEAEKAQQVPITADPIEEPVYEVRFVIYGTKSELRSVSEYLKNTGLRYERI